MRIGILGATGPAGSGLAARLADIGNEVLFGSRRLEKAETAVATLRERWGERVKSLVPLENADACDAPVVVLGVTADAAIDTVNQHAHGLGGRIVVSMANDLVRNGTEFNAQLPPHGSVAAEIQALLPESRVVTAFHLVPAAEFGDLEHEMESDVVVLGNDPEAVATMMEIVESIRHLRAFDGGSLANAVGMEAFSAVLLTINMRHRCKASLRLAGV